MRTTNAGIEGLNPISGAVNTGMDDELRQIVDRLRRDRRLQHLDREQLAHEVSKQLSAWANNPDWFATVLQILYTASDETTE